MSETNEPTQSLDRDELCRVFGLGAPTGDWIAVPGARSHTMWSLVTDRGRYAVKVFDTSVDHTRSPDWRRHLNAAVVLELAACRAGLPLPRPIPVAGSRDDAVLTDVSTGTGTATVRVHEWATGSPVPDDVAQPELAAVIGGLLARLHQLPVPCPHEQAAGLRHTHTDDHIAGLAAHARQRGYAWAPALDSARAAYQTIRDLADQRHHHSWPLITTHRDLGPKNVLLSAAHTPVIVDWDVAGPWTVVEETASAALEWAGVLAGPPNRDAVLALVTGYRGAGGTLAVTGPEAFAGWLVKNANWTEMHVRHALDDDLPSSRRHAAEQAVPQLVDQLERFACGAPSWADWLCA
jgi:Ser/Thr protein kinase RdoA (MazF antagonist)